MPSSIAELFAAAGLRPVGMVRWGEPIPLDGAGVYAVAVTDQTSHITGAILQCPLSPSAIGELLRARPELRVDGARPSKDALGDRLASLSLPDELVIYVGLAGTSLRRRVGDYYKTPLGARRPHAGGWPLKTLSILSELCVHYAPCADPNAAELTMLDAFIRGVSASSRAALRDPNLPIPFANLERSKGERQRHGITGAREPGPRTTRGPHGGATW